MFKIDISEKGTPHFFFAVSSRSKNLKKFIKVEKIYTSSLNFFQILVWRIT